MTEDGGIKQCANDHHDNGEDFLAVCIGTHITEPDRSHTGHGEIQCSYVFCGFGGPVYDVGSGHVLAHNAESVGVGYIAKLPQPAIKQTVIG